MISVPLFPAFPTPARRFISLAATLLVSTSIAISQQAAAAPVKIFILAGQSNMLGKGTISPVGTPGTLDYIVANEPAKYGFLKSGDSYVVRNDVYIRDQDPNTGGLTVGYGGEAAGLIGPELGFGHRIGDVNENRVLIVKCAWGGKDLAFNFCPPSSRVGEPAPLTSGNKGFYYKEILRLVSEATSNLATYVPGYSGEGYQIAGFGWHQGYNDRIDPARSAAYETNMARFINDIRSDLSAPNMPFVIATTGMDGLSGYGYTQVEKAQLKMADATAYPAFVGNVAVVDTRATYEDLDFWQNVANSPVSEGYHWNKNAKTYLHIGLAMGDAMSLLAPVRCPYRPRADGDPAGVSLTWKNGTETPTSVRVLRNGSEIAAAAPAVPASFVDTTAPLGTNTYELQFTMPVSACDPLTLSHNTGITGLQAKRRVNGLNLSWSNGLGYTAIKVSRNGSVIEASLPGSTSSYVDRTPPAGAVTYTVEPIDAGTTPAQVQVTVSAAPAGTTVIYEPFDMTAATSLNDKSGGIGLDGKWVAGSTVQVTAGSLALGSLPTFGNRIVRTSGSGASTIVIGTSLSDAGLLNDGAELWFSFLCPNPNSTGDNPTFVLGNDALSNSTTVANSGSAIGARLEQGKNVQAAIYSSGGVAGISTTQTTLTSSEMALVVGHITWGANPGSADTIEIYTPGTNLVLDTPQSISAVVDQSTFRVLTMWGNVSGPNIDEIRFGATYADVIGQGVDTSGDLSPPTPPTMSFASAPAAVTDSMISMTATTVSDANGVQYRFHNTTLNTYSAWQESPTFTNTGLAANTLYSFTVQARDKSVNQNTNTASPSAAATTLSADTNPPPTPGFATAPTAISYSEITMTATTVIDADGNTVQYRFNNTTLGTNSGWQSGTTYTDRDLMPDTTYLYTVQARDLASTPNESSPSAPVSATTQVFVATNGTWNIDSDGLWSDETKWSGNTIANGAGATAFLTKDITIARAITLDTDRTVGNITFTDSTNSNNNLSISGSNTLTLDVASGSPVIDVTQSGRILTINTALAGSDGLRKSGPGMLILGANNTYAGTTLVSAGHLNFQGISLTGFGDGTGRNISVSAGAIVQRTTLDNAFLNRLVETADVFGVFTGATNNNLDFSSTGANLPNAFLGNWAGNGAKCEYSGIITPASDAYRLGFAGSNGLLGIRSILSGSQGLIVGSRVNLVAANTFTGDTTIPTGAKLVIGNNLALQNSALDVGSAGGTFACAAGTVSGRITGETAATSPTFGGLKGSRNLSAAFTASSGGNNESNLVATAITAFTLNPGSGKTCTYSGIIANFAAGTTLTKTGAGTQILSGANSYTGTTSVNQGTLALVGGSQSSAIIVATGASLGFTLGSPTTSTSSVDLTNGTVKITGTVDNASDYLLMTASSISGTAVLDSPIPNYTLQKVAGNTQIKLVYTPSASPYDTWKTQITNGLNLRTDDADGDGFTNIEEFLFGSSPIVGNGTLVTTTASGGNLILRWLQRETGATYLLKQSTTLATGSWTPAAQSPALDGNQSGAPTACDYHTATIPTGGGKMFYRIEGVEN